MDREGEEMNAKEWALSIKEKAFQQQIIHLARLNQWLVYHTWRSDHSEAGFPDLVLTKTLEHGDTVTLVVELKSEKGKVTLSQAHWLEQLNKTNGIFAFICVPSQFDNIAMTLQAKGLPDIMVAWKNSALFAKSHFGLNLATPTKD